MEEGNVKIAWWKQHQLLINLEKQPGWRDIVEKYKEENTERNTTKSL
jgi:hypothetical protein